MDVPATKFVEATKRERPDIIGMSAFLTTTGLRYPEVIEALQEAGIREKAKIMIDGAAANQKIRRGDWSRRLWRQRWCGSKIGQVIYGQAIKLAVPEIR